MADGRSAVPAMPVRPRWEALRVEVALGSLGLEVPETVCWPDEARALVRGTAVPVERPFAGAELPDVVIAAAGDEKAFWVLVKECTRHWVPAVIFAPRGMRVRAPDEVRWAGALLRVVVPGNGGKTELLGHASRAAHEVLRSVAYLRARAFWDGRASALRARLSWFDPVREPVKEKARAPLAVSLALHAWALAGSVFPMPWNLESLLATSFDTAQRHRKREPEALGAALTAEVREEKWEAVLDDEHALRSALTEAEELVRRLDDELRALSPEFVGDPAVSLAQARRLALAAAVAATGGKVSAMAFRLDVGRALVRRYLERAGLEFDLAPEEGPTHRGA